MKKIWKLYLDTSVFGGCFDVKEGWDRDSRRVIEGVRAGKACLVYTETLVSELESAPDHVRVIWESIPENAKRLFSLSDDVRRLGRTYVDEGIIGEQWMDDALHIASATIAGADAIVSRNFKHMVRFDKVTAYNLVNLKLGHGILSIVTPREVIFDE